MAIKKSKDMIQPISEENIYGFMEQTNKIHNAAQSLHRTVTFLAMKFMGNDTAN
jgi:hypothetical protein